MVEACTGEIFDNGETEEKYQCLCCNASEDECVAILMVKTRLKQKEDKDEQAKEAKEENFADIMDPCLYVRLGT